jgi:predicted glycosyltransferase
MTREAAYLGVPAVSVFRGAVGQVDAYLERIGRLRVVRSDDDLSAFDLRELKRVEPLFTNRSAAGDIAESVVQAIGRDARAATISNSGA